MGVEIPSWLSGALSVEDVGRIDAAVKKAEARTSAEIVPMVVHRSTLKATGDRILFWICFGVLGIGGAVGLTFSGVLDEAVLDRLIEVLGLWPTAELHFILAVVMELVLAFAAFGVAWLSAKWLSGFDSAHRLAFPVDDLTLEAEHRAQSEFFSSDLRSTAGQTGVLLFVSMLEHRAVILADQAILAKLEPSVWTKVLNTLIDSIRRGEMAAGYVTAIESMGDLLSPHFPRATDDVNELSDGLRIVE